MAAPVLRTAEGGVLAVSRVRGDPGEDQWGAHGSKDHGAGEVVLGGEVALVGDLGSSAAFAVLGPGFGQIELAVDQGVTAGGGVGGEDTDLAVFGAAAVPEYCRCTPAEVVPILMKPVSSMINTPSDAPSCSAA